MSDEQHTPERLGILGGTFDPPHAGHLAAARACRDGLSLDRVLLVVANDPWQKTRHITPAADRLAMVEAACEGESAIAASDLEIRRGGPSYTIDTVEALQAQAERAGYPAPELFLVIGSDLVPTLPSWHRADDLRVSVTLAVVSRPHSPVVSAPGWEMSPVAGDAVDVSSSEVRHLLERGKPVDGMLPSSVVRCIARRGLYAVRR